MSATGAFYVLDGRRYVSTELTRGPWSNDHQHGGPPAALLGRAMERWGEDAAEFMVTRVTVEILRPVPIAPLDVDVEPLRVSRRAQRLTARLVAGGVEVARAFGLRARIGRLDLPPPRVAPRPAFPDPLGFPAFTFPFFQHPAGYHTAVDIRIARGEWGHGPAAAWLRLRVPLVAGEETSPLERVLVIADAGNGRVPGAPHPRVYLHQPGPHRGAGPAGARRVDRS